MRCTELTEVLVNQATRTASQLIYRVLYSPSVSKYSKRRRKVKTTSRLAQPGEEAGRRTKRVVLSNPGGFRARGVRFPRLCNTTRSEISEKERSGVGRISTMDLNRRPLSSTDAAEIGENGTVLGTRAPRTRRTLFSGAGGFARRRRRPQSRMRRRW